MKKTQCTFKSTPAHTCPTKTHHTNQAELRISFMHVDIAQEIVFSQAPADFRALSRRWWTVTPELTSRPHRTTHRESDDHVTTAHQWQASQPRGGERPRRWTHYQQIHVPAQCHSDEREHVRSCRSYMVNDRCWWTGQRGDGVEWEVGFWLPLVRTIGLTTEEGGEEEGSAGFKERQTDQSYSSANHPLYTCVCSCGNLRDKVSVSVFWGTFVGSFAGETPHSTSVFLPAEGTTAHGPFEEEPYWRMGWWHTQTHAQIRHLTSGVENLSAGLITVCVCVCVLQWVCVTACGCVFNFYMQRDRFLNPLQCHDRLKCLSLCFMLLVAMTTRLIQLCLCGRTAEDLATPTMHVAHTLQNLVNGITRSKCASVRQLPR